METQSVFEGAKIAKFEVYQNGIIKIKEDSDFYPAFHSIYYLVSGYFPSIIQLSELINSDKKIQEKTLLITKPVPHFARVIVYKDIQNRILIFIKPLKVLQKGKNKEIFVQLRRFEGYTETFMAGFSYKIDEKEIIGCFNPYFEYSVNDLRDSIRLKLTDTEIITIFPLSSNKNLNNIFYGFITEINGIKVTIYLYNIYSKAFSYWVKQIFKIVWVSEENKKKLKVNKSVINEIYDAMNIGLLLFNEKGDLIKSNEFASKLGLLFENININRLDEIMKIFNYPIKSSLRFSKPITLKKAIQNDPYSGLSLHIIPFLDSEYNVKQYLAILYEINENSIIPLIDESVTQPLILKLINSASEGIIFYDSDMNTLYLNKYAQELLSAPDNIINLPNALMFDFKQVKLMIPDFLITVIQFLYSIISGSDVKEIKIRADKNRDITLRQLSSYKKENGSQIIILNVFSKKERAQKESQELFSLKIWKEVLSVIYDPIALIDKNKNVIIANEAFQKISKKILTDLMETFPEFINKIFESSEKKAIWRKEIIDGTEYYYELNKINNDYFVISFTNVSEIYNVLEETKQASDRLADINQKLSFQVKLFTETFQDALLFLKATSHDLKAPLRAIGTFSMFIEESLGDDKEIKELTEKITNLTDSTAAALEEIVKISRTFYREEKEVNRIDPIEFLLEIINTTILREYFIIDVIPKIRSVYWLDAIDKVKSLFWVVLISSVPFIFQYKWSLQVFLNSEEEQVILKITRKGEIIDKDKPRLGWFTINALRRMSPAIYPIAGYNIHVVNYKEGCTIYLQPEDRGVYT